MARDEAILYNIRTGTRLSPDFSGRELPMFNFISELFENFSISDSCTASTTFESADAECRSVETAGPASAEPEPSAFNSYGTAASDFQCAGEASSASPSFSCTEETWGSSVDASSSYDSGSSSDAWS